MSPTTSILIEMLRTGKVGDIITDETMTEKCKKDTSTNGKGNANLSSAIRHCEKTHGVVWRRQSGCGYIKCLNASERVDVARSASSSIARKSRRTVRVLDTINVADLADGQKTEYLSLSAQHRILAVMATERASKAIGDAGINNNVQLPKLLEALKHANE
jgi:hypothetical protein